MEKPGENITLITGNPGKIEEFNKVLYPLNHVDIDLPEIQAIYSKDVVANKLVEARNHIPHSDLIVEDTALHLNAFKGFPGALIKWLLKSVGCAGISELCDKMQENAAIATSVLGYLSADDNTPRFFSSSMNGQIVSPRGDNGFGWDPIFVPAGYNKTLAEMEANALRNIKMRRKAAIKLGRYLGLKAGENVDM